MGYAHGKQWKEGELKNAVLNMVTILELDRMPSKKEMEEYFGNSSATNKISKNGGFYYHADLWGLPIKNSETSFGLKYEKVVMNLLVELGFGSELTSLRHSYDILVNKRVKIDVKVGRLVRSGPSDYYTFNLEKKMQSCDVYVALTLGLNDVVEKVYVIPASVMSGKKQLSIGVNESKYDGYIERWDIIKVLDDCFHEVENMKGHTIRYGLLSGKVEK